MLEARETARLITVVILGIVLLSGPLVPFVDFTSADASTPSDGVSSATVSVVSPPSDDFRIAPARFGAGVYLYSVSMRVHVQTVTGSPTLIYELRVPGLGRNEVAVAFLGEPDEGRDLVLELGRGTVDPARVTESTYTATVELRLRAGNETRIIHQQTVTIPVEGLDER
jgi:hypothetical protein